MTTKTYPELSTEQKEQVSTKYSNILTGREPETFVYDIDNSGAVVSRQRIAGVAIKCQSCNKSFKAMSVYEYRAGICPNCWRAGVDNAN